MSKCLCCGRPFNTGNSPNVEECDGDEICEGFSAGYRAGIEAAAKFMDGLIPLHSAEIRALAQPAATGEGEP
jgi:hypothetical protein